ncbi:ervatamin-C-like [Trifolium pratense]|uniref:ervatamin-C-like n=1 Tax=Trifolium pratense TaxID=57577 RepID=UPI001E69275F|nr:ervatamin-C-like [Trifolium pratense]
MSLTLPSQSSIDEIHHQWMIKYGRMYANTSEMEKRRIIFKKNLEFIERRNKINRAAGKNYTLGLNDFSDLNTDEVISCSGIMNIPDKLISSNTMFFFNDIPESVDWRERGAVTSVKRQGTCGCCWAFATMAAIEGIWQIRMGDLISLSAQHLIDCDPGSNGCRGGYLNSAFEFERVHSGGVPSEKDYPFKEIQQACRNKFIPSAGFDGYRFVPRGDEQQLLQVVAQQPVAAQIATCPEFEAYSGDRIYSGPCGPVLNHAVAIVGYGVSADGQKYWIIKNSWGEFWGESGYMKLIRGTGSRRGHCDITAGYSIYPTLTV